MSDILIVEDDKIQCSTLKQTLCKAYPNWNIDTASSFEEATFLLMHSKQNYSLFLLDIQLSENTNDRSGFQLAEQIRAMKPYYTTPILFLTSISVEMGYGLSEYHCYNYITKPYSATDIITQIKHMLFTGILQNSIVLKDTMHIHHKVNLSDVLYLEGKSRLLVLYTNIDKLETKDYTLTTISSFLSSQFIQCHRRYIINSNYIENYDFTNNYVQINNHSIPIGRTYRNNLKNILL